MNHRIFKFRIICLAVIAALVLGTRAIAAGNGRVIVIDPGHGSVNNRRAIEGPTELAIANKLKARLVADGYTVVMTRTQNGQRISGAASGAEYKDLRARAEIANKANADMVVSIHSDANGSDKFHILYPDVAGPDKFGVTSPHIDNYLPVAKKMANAVHGAMVSAGFDSMRAPHGEAYNNANNKAGWGKPLMISAHSKAPVITVEVYGHNDPSLVKKYAQSSVQDKVAAALQQGVNRYFSVNSKASASGPKEPEVKAATNEPAGASNKIDRGNNCPPKTPPAGQSAGQDQRPQIAQAFAAELSRRTEAMDQYNNGLSSAVGPMITGAGQCALPIPGNSRVISGLEGSRGSANHRGFDFSAPTGTPIVSVMDGVVVLVSDGRFADNSGYWGNTSANGGYGNYIRIRHDNGLYSEYHHVRTGRIRVRLGERVTKGSVIAEVDNNGWSSGSHLHFQMMNANETAAYINPGPCLGLSR